MKSKRWKRRNRHTRPEWVEVYAHCDFENRINWRGYSQGWRFNLLYTYPNADWLYKECGLVGTRDLVLNTSPQRHQTLSATTI